MGILKNILKNAVSDGISKGVRDAVSSAVEKAVRPSAEKWADETARQLDDAARQISQANAAADSAAPSGDPFARLQKAADRYAASVPEADKKAANASFSFPAADGSEKPYENDFLALVERNGGFELALGFRDWEDHLLGGRGDRVWYLITNGKKTECYTAVFSNGAWSDVFFNGRGAPVPCESGRTLAMIARRAYHGRAAIEADKRSPVPTENAGHRCSRYNDSFGAVSCDVSDEFGVTVRFSDCDHAENGFSLRAILTGNAVEVPELS